MQYQCPCGQWFNRPTAFPVRCVCGRQYTEPQLAELPADDVPQGTRCTACPDRGELIATMTELQGCGCNGVQVYPCACYSEVVTLKPACEKGKQVLRLEYAQYANRNCRTCQLARIASE